LYKTTNALEGDWRDAGELEPALGSAEAIARRWAREYGSPLLVLDCDRIRTQYRQLVAALPGVTHHYAIKALPHPAVIATLDAEGASFDLSINGEIRLLRDQGIAPHRIIHTHPIKQPREIQASLDYGCSTFVVDNVWEMEKLVPYRNQVQVLLRVGFCSPDAVVDLAKKYGCPIADVLALLEHGTKLGLAMRGLSFHVGSQCPSPDSHLSAVVECLRIIEAARTAGIASLEILDIGGGFPVSYRSEVPGIAEFCAPIRRALEAAPRDLRVLTEPGRYLVAPAMESIATVIGKARRGDAFWYYLDDGVYGSYSGRLFDRAEYPIATVPERLGDRHASVLAGPTCDSIDVIAEEIQLPELEIGDLVVGRSMGAYSAASASEFNSIPKTTILVLNCPPPRDPNPFDDWVPRDYLHEYYRDLPPDEVEAIRYFVDGMRGTARDSVLCFGCGPTLHHVFLVGPHMTDLVLADYLPRNLAEIAAWQRCDTDAHDWTLFARYRRSRGLGALLPQHRVPGAARWALSHGRVAMLAGLQGGPPLFSLGQRRRERSARDPRPGL
jgi:ornithine decarboxylase